MKIWTDPTNANCFMDVNYAPKVPTIWKIGTDSEFKFIIQVEVRFSFNFPKTSHEIRIRYPQLDGKTILAEKWTSKLLK